ncbi:MAG: hypothetical protein Q8T08_08520 [Ignavibacteria bacterium]|nr:hypothetical protein [Ignavibacteria bacterium]
MRIAVTDACIFIDLIDLNLLDQLCSLPMVIYTTIDVLHELNPVQQKLILRLQSESKIFIETLSSEEMSQILTRDYPAALSLTDRTVIFLSEKLDAVLISSDKAVRNYAGKCAIEYHGILWVLDQLVDSKIITIKSSREKLDILTKNKFYANNSELMTEINKRLNSN